jgi:quinol monooxygenase YgiN
MAGFVQIIEFQSSRIDDIRNLVEQMRDRGPGLAVRGNFTADRDRPNTYVNIVEFESAEAAEENSNRPETQEFAAKMAELCDGPASFRNLDLIENWQA